VATIGRAREDARLPYQPFLDALLPLAGRLSEMDPEDGRRLRAFLRLESESHDEPARADPPATGADRQVLFLTVLRALEHLASSRPLALLLDDLHWADRASLDLLEFLAVALRRGASDGPFPIVVAAA